MENLKHFGPYTPDGADLELMQKAGRREELTPEEKDRLADIIRQIAARGFRAPRTKSPANPDGQFTPLEFSRRNRRPPFAAHVAPAGSPGWERVGGFLVLHDADGYVAPGHVWAARSDEFGDFRLFEYRRKERTAGQGKIPLKVRAIQERAIRYARGEDSIEESFCDVPMSDIQDAAEAAGAYVPTPEEIWAVFGLCYVPRKGGFFEIENPRGLK